MNRAIGLLALVAGIACLNVSVRADDTDTPPPRTVVAPPDSDELPKLGDYVYVEELPEAVHQPGPVYPEAARQAGVTGTVMVQALIGKDGLVKDTRVMKSIPLLDSAAVEAVRQWKFKPALVKNEPVAVWVAIPVRFSLDGKSAPMSGGAVKPPAPAPEGATPQRAPAPPPQHGIEPAPPAPTPIEDAPESDEPVEKLYVDAFNVRLAATGDSAWAQAPATIAIELVGGADCECARFTVDVGSPPERFDEADVTVTRDGFLDDSVHGDRYRLHMRRTAAGIWNLTRATVAWRCQKDRGHEGYSSEPCK
jgi:TonB family protein